MKKKAYNKITAEGTIVRGCVYLEKPGFHATTLVQQRDQKNLLAELRNVKNILATELRIQRSMLEIDTKKARIITSEKIVRRYADALKRMKLVPAVVEEIPEQNFLDVQIDFL